MTAAAPPALRSHVPLASLTTLGLGGPARWLAEAERPEDVVAALRWAAAEGVTVTILGGGSNVVVADAGVDGLVVRLGLRGVERRPDDDAVLVTAAAGEPWDRLVETTVEEGLAGLECLSGIPGTAGASPIQNVGAYGQEVSDVLDSVRVVDREALEERTLTPSECAMGYRDSRFRRHPGRFVVLAVTFRLVRGGEPALRYPELARVVAAGGREPDLRRVRETVLALRRSKSMVLEPEDENRQSVGSFFVNPVLPAAEAARVAERAAALGVVGDPSEVPRFSTGTAGETKLSAGWLIEAAGFAKGERRGPVGLSSRHALALVHHGGGTTARLLALAREIRGRVEERFGVRLRPEPIFLGFGDDDPLGE
jgi:UDP-N-acetylmuramate dehydrogenase